MTDRYPAMEDFSAALEDATRGKAVRGWQREILAPKPVNDADRRRKAKSIPWRPIVPDLWSKTLNVVQMNAKGVIKTANEIKSSVKTRGGKISLPSRSILGRLSLGIAALLSLIVLFTQIRTPVTTPDSSGIADLLAQPAGIYYTSMLAGSEQVFYYDLVNSQHIIPPNLPDGSRSAAPDGRGNLFFVAGEDEDIDIYVLRASGKVDRVTTTLGAANSWSPSPDRHGNLYFVSDRSREIDTYRFSMATGETKRLTTTLGAASSWSPAPDGHGSLYFVSDRSGEIDIYRFSTATGETKRLTTTLGSAHSWSPVPTGANDFYFISDRNRETTLYLFLGDTQETKKIATTLSSATSWLRAPEDYQIR
jgi:dipeptidyl aminopeptidase/acylaminoacyl peptidase